MDTRTIDRVLKKHCNIYRGTYSSDTLPTIMQTWRPLVIVVNTDPASQPGTHWICMFFDECGNGEYFDSFGKYPTRSFERYMYKNCNVWTFCNKQLQSVISRFCGHYCIWYCVMKARKCSLTELLRNVSNDTGLNDYLAHKFACTLIGM
jgi:hypothetical protein